MSSLENSVPPVFDSPEALPPKKNRGKVLLIILAIVLILICCLGVIAAFLYFDPFGWGLLSFLSRKDPVAEATPIDSTAYAGVDLLNVDTEKAQSLVTVFEDAYQEYATEYGGLPDDFQAQINDSLDEFDINFEEDILPWIGRHAGFGLLELELDSYGSLETASYFVALETRDRDAADAFLLKLTDGISDSRDISIDTSLYEDTTIYIVDDPYQSLAFARYKNLVIMADSPDSIRQMIDASSSDSIADDPVYRDLIGQLPKERIFNFYLPGDALSKLYQTAIQDMSLLGTSVANTYDIISGVAFSLSIVDAGLQFDTLMAYDPAKLSASQIEMMESTGRGSPVTDQLPGDTLLYFSGQRPDLIWQTYYDTMNESLGGDFEESMAELEDEIGINLNTDLFPYLDGVYAIAVFPSDTGSLAQLANIKLGIAILAQTSDDAALLDTVEAFNPYLEDLADLTITESSTANMTIFEASIFYFEQPILAYGVGSGWFGLTSSLDVLEALPDRADSLSESDYFRQVQGYLPSGMSVAGYIDFKHGLEAIRSSLSNVDLEIFDQATVLLEPIDALVAGSSPFNGDSMHSTLILVIPTEN